MDAHAAILGSMATADFLVKNYLQDLDNANLMLRPTAGANHIAWQLGHLIVAEHRLISTAAGDERPPLPPGFEERYTTETSESDDPAAFLSKDEYLRLYDQQRGATRATLAKLSATDLDRPAPEKWRQLCPTVGDLFLLSASHPVMHAGQWVIVRRQLGKKALF